MQWNGNVAPMGVKFGMEERSPSPCQISPPSVKDKRIGPPKLKFLLIFDQNVEYKRPAGRIPCTIFTTFAEFVPSFRMH